MQKRYWVAVLALVLLQSGCNRGSSSSSQMAQTGDESAIESDPLLLGAAVDGSQDLETVARQFESVDPNVINGFALTAVYERLADGSRNQVTEIDPFYDERQYRANPADIVRKFFYWNENGQLLSWTHGASFFFDREDFIYNENFRLTRIAYRAELASDSLSDSKTINYRSSGLFDVERSYGQEGELVSEIDFIWVSNLSGFVAFGSPNEISVHYDRGDSASYMTDNEFFQVDPLNEIEAINLYNEVTTFSNPIVTAEFNTDGNIVRLTYFNLNAESLENEIETVYEFEYEWVGQPVLNLPLHVARHQPLLLLELVRFINN